MYFNNKKKSIIYEVLTQLLPKTNEKYNTKLIKKYFDNWRDKVYKLGKRDDRLKNALDDITKRQLINLVLFNLHLKL